MIDPVWQSVQRILLVRLDNLGDVLLMTPAFHALKRALPQASLTLLTSPVGAQVGRLDPDIDDVIVFEAPWIDPWARLPQDSTREQTMIAHLRTRHFDAAIIFTSFRQSSLPAAYMCYLADIPLRLAASADGSGSLLTLRHRHPERIMHEVERGLDLVGALGIDTHACDMVLRVPAEADKAITAWLASADPAGRPLIVVHPGCSMPARTYPWELYAQVLTLLVKQLGTRVVVTGMENEQALVNRILMSVPLVQRQQIMSLAGKLPFAQLCALIRCAALVITNNTGPMHIAAALKTPVVALFALTNPPEQWGPWHVPQRILFHDVACRLCYQRSCPYQHECLRLVTPQMVIDAAVEMLTESDHRPPTAARTPGITYENAGTSPVDIVAEGGKPC